MEISADREACLAYGNCIAVAPEVYDLDGGKVRVLTPTPAPDQEPAARKGARRCPVHAITIGDT